MIQLLFSILIVYLLLGVIIGLEITRKLSGKDRVEIILNAMFLWLPVLLLTFLEALKDDLQEERA